MELFTIACFIPAQDNTTSSLFTQLANLMNCAYMEGHQLIESQNHLVGTDL